MNARQWQLARRVPGLLEAELGLTDRQLAERLGVTMAELRAPIAVLIRQGLVDRCWTGTESHVVAPAAAGQGVSAA